MIVRLGPNSVPEIRRLLLRDPVVNLFLLGFLELHPLDRCAWIGAYRGGAGLGRGGSLTGVALLVPGRLVVPYAPDLADAAELGAHLKGRFDPTMVVGPRDASDALWQAWTRGRVRALRFYDQRLYTRAPLPGDEGAQDPALRLARPEEWREISEHSARMEIEDLGRDPRAESRSLHERVVRDRIDRGVTWVLEREGRIAFQINVGTATEHGCQVGGTFVPPELRGRGLAVDGMRAVCRRLLREHPLITLHVNEANAPAVRTYERVGFVRGAAFRLLTV